MKIHDAARRGDILDIAKELSAGVSIDVREIVTQFTALQCACSTPLAGAMCIRFLVKEGAEVSREVFDSAVQNASIEALETLIQFGAIVDGRPRDGCGSLALAALGRSALDNSTLLPVLNYLLTQGAHPSIETQYGESAIHIASGRGRFDAVQLLLDAGADPNAPMPFGVCAINEAPDMESTRVLSAAGARLRQISPEARRHLAGGSGGDPDASLDEYRSGRLPVFGKFNGQRMLSPFWHAMVRRGCNAYTARRVFSDESYSVCPTWCYDRFGRSSTMLPDGRVVEIGGEHEDSSDPDFCIYNDVVVFDGKGDFEILGYPESVFPPTDFHSATLVGGHIYIIGCAGYKTQRQSEYTPVYRLSTKSWEIEHVETSGDNPGWIWGHNAEYRATDHAIAVYQSDEKGQSHSDFTARRLDLRNFAWAKM